MQHNKTLVLTNDNYADEFDVFGVEVFSTKTLNKMLKKLDDHFKEEPEEEFEVYFGTNESISFNKDFKDSFIFKEISEEELEALKKFIPIPCGQNLLEPLYDYLEDYD